MPVRINRYELAWSPNTNAGFITLFLADNRRIKVPAETIEEFIAIAMVLNQSPVYFYPDGAIAGSDVI